MLSKIIIVDFDDSFTYNIASTLYPFEADCSVIHHRKFFEIIKDHKFSDQKIAIVLGPGPGHPNEYQQYFPQIKWILEQSQIYLMGICLGHQIMGTVFGHEIRYVKDQMHGVAVEFNFNGSLIKVQRYNSLGVFNHDDELVTLKWPRGISYQFHPESVGTENNQTFFQELLLFIQSW
jgi:anthranilate/para-aminobenzoate synthase component II